MVNNYEGYGHLHNTTNLQERKGTMTVTSSTPTASPIAQIEALYDRLSRARTLVAGSKFHPVVNMPDLYVVEGSAGFYIVNDTCCCNDAASRNDLIKGHCKHKLAALLYSEQQSQAENNTPKATRKAQADSPRDEELESKVPDLYR
jgi:hypothetical protein